MNRQTESCQALQVRIDELEQEARDRDERALHQRQERQRTDKAKRDAALRHATDWPEAFIKQRLLIAPELRMAQKTLAETEADTRYTDPTEKARDVEWWRADVASLQADLAMIDVAERIYQEEVATAQVELDAIRKRQLAAVATRLRVRDELTGNSFFAELLEKLEHDDPSAWLNW